MSNSRLEQAIAAMYRIATRLLRIEEVVSSHSQCVAELGRRVNHHTDRLDELAAILNSSIPPEHEAPQINHNPLVLHLLEHGDNVISHPNFRERQP